MSRVLMVSPYPPIRDGIGTYAAQEVKRLLLAGDHVEALSPQPSAAHHHLVLRGPRGPLALAKRVAAYDRVVVQYHPDVFYPHPVGPSERMAITSGLLACCLRARNVEFRIHEFKTEWGGSGAHAKLLRLVWLAARRVEVHTETEREQFCAAYDLPLDAVHVVPHGAHFEAHAAGSDRDAVRAELGIQPGEHCFLSIGFLQPHKGFDRAVRAFARLPVEPGTARIDVVGGLRLEEPEYLSYVEDLRDLVAQTPGAHLHEGFVSDRRFDEWLLAADTIVLPYRTIWSSGVVERARLYGTSVIATRVGGLAAQASDVATFVRDDDELAAAMAARLALGSGGDAEIAPDWEPIVHPGETPDREAVQAALRSRAGVRAEVARPSPAGAAPRGRALPRLALPQPQSARPLGRLAKRLVHRLTYWQLAPIVHHVNELQRAVDRSDRRQESSECADSSS